MDPFYSGTTANEIDFDPTNQDMNTWDWTKYEQEVRGHISTFGSDIAEQALKMYPINVTSAEYEYTKMGADIRLGCPNDHMSNIISAGMKSPVYRYVVTSQPSKPINALGMPFPSSYSLHMWDMFAYFGTIKSYIKPPASSDEQFKDTMRREVLSFVRTGSPSTKGWLPYSRRITAILSENTSVASNYKLTTCMFWSYNGLASYAWIN